MRTTALHRSTLIWVLATAACAGGAPAAGDDARALGAPDSPGGCVVDRTPLTAGLDTFVYVEPEDLIRLGSEFLVVGSPTYTWAPGTPGDSVPVTARQHLAARFGLDGRATLIEPPIRDSIGSVRALALEGDRWGVLFDIAWATLPDPVSRTLALWYAEHDGTSWPRLESVPIPAGMEIDLHASTELVRAGEELVWVAAARLPNGPSRVLEYRRTAGAWRHEVVSDEWVEGSTLVSDGDSSLWLALYGRDVSFADFRKSLRLYRRAQAGWELTERIAVFPGGPLLADLTARVGSEGVELTWRVDGRGDDGAYARLGVGRNVSATRIDLDRRVLQVVPLEPPGGGLRWLVTRVASDDRGLELRILGRRPLFGAEVLAATPSPYLAFLTSLALSASEVLVVGPEVSSDPADPFVRSLILRLSTSCD